jgi:hypothetical protein
MTKTSARLGQVKEAELMAKLAMKITHMAARSNSLTILIKKSRRRLGDIDGISRQVIDQPVAHVLT